MENKILTGEGFCDFECECGENLGTEENMQDACSEPFNGVIIQCPKCKKEYDITIGFKIEKI
jgi:hypothetical protein